MRLGIRAKQIAGVTAIVGITVIVISVLYLAQVAKVVLQESDARAKLLTQAAIHRARDLVTDGPDPYVRLRTDPGLQAILQSSLYDVGVIDASVLDPDSTVVVNGNNTGRDVGSVAPRRRSRCW